MADEPLPHRPHDCRSRSDAVTEPHLDIDDVTLAVEAIGQVVGGFRVRWYDEQYEGWDAILEPDVECSCSRGGCYCCEGASVTREQVDALRRVGVEITEVP